MHVRGRFSQSDQLRGRLGVTSDGENLIICIVALDRYAEPSMCAKLKRCMLDGKKTTKWKIYCLIVCISIDSVVR